MVTRKPPFHGVNCQGSKVAREETVALGNLNRPDRSRVQSGRGKWPKGDDYEAQLISANWSRRKSVGGHYWLSVLWIVRCRSSLAIVT